MVQLDHKHIIINAKIAHPPGEGTESWVVDWLKRVIEAVGMKLVIGPHAHYCKAEDNEGITATCCIETSHASLHIWDKLDDPLLRFDLYSCAEFDPNVVVRMLDEFQPYELEYMVLDRNHEIKIVESVIVKNP